MCNQPCHQSYRANLQCNQSHVLNQETTSKTIPCIYEETTHGKVKIMFWLAISPSSPTTHSWIFLLVAAQTQKRGKSSPSSPFRFPIGDHEMHGMPAMCSNARSAWHQQPCQKQGAHCVIASSSCTSCIHSSNERGRLSRITSDACVDQKSSTDL